MGNAATFAQTLSQQRPGSPVSVRSCAIQNNPQLMQRNHGRSWRRARPRRTPARTSTTRWRPVAANRRRQLRRSPHTAPTSSPTCCRRTSIRSRRTCARIRWRGTTRSPKGDPGAVKPPWRPTSVGTRRTRRHGLCAGFGDGKEPVRLERRQFASSRRTSRGCRRTRRRPLRRSSAQSGVAQSYPKLTGEDDNVIEARQAHQPDELPVHGRHIHGMGRISFGRPTIKHHQLLTMRGGSAQGRL